MDDIFALVGYAGLLGFFVAIIWLIIAAIAKKKKKPAGILLLISSYLFLSYACVAYFLYVLSVDGLIALLVGFGIPAVPTLLIAILAKRIEKKKRKNETEETTSEMLPKKKKKRIGLRILLFLILAVCAIFAYHNLGARNVVITKNNYLDYYEWRTTVREEFDNKDAYGNYRSRVVLIQLCLKDEYTTRWSGASNIEVGYTYIQNAEQGIFDINYDTFKYSVVARDDKTRTEKSETGTFPKHPIYVQEMYSEDYVLSCEDLEVIRVGGTLVLYPKYDILGINQSDMTYGAPATVAKASHAVAASG